MDKKYFVVTYFRCTNHISETEFEGDAMESRIASIRDELGALLERIGMSFHSVESEFFNSTKYFLGACHVCGIVCVDRDSNPAGCPPMIASDVLINGGLVDSKLKCENCLPADHRWA